MLFKEGEILIYKEFLRKSIIKKNTVIKKSNREYIQENAYEFFSFVRNAEETIVIVENENKELLTLPIGIFEIPTESEVKTFKIKKMFLK